jgi:hypothetical protein
MLASDKFEDYVRHRKADIPMKTAKASQALKTDQDIVRQRVDDATGALTQSGQMGGPKDRKLSVRVESRLLELARRRTGIAED